MKSENIYSWNYTVNIVLIEQVWFNISGYLNPTLPPSYSPSPKGQREKYSEKGSWLEARPEKSPTDQHCVKKNSMKNLLTSSPENHLCPSSGQWQLICLEPYGADLEKLLGSAVGSHLCNPLLPKPCHPNLIHWLCIKYRVVFLNTQALQKLVLQQLHNPVCSTDLQYSLRVVLSHLI